MISEYLLLTVAGSLILLVKRSSSLVLVYNISDISPIRKICARIISPCYYYIARC